MKKNFILFTLIIFFVGGFIIFNILHKPILKEDYIKIEIGPESNICLTGNKIDEFEEYINKMYKRKTIKRQEVCQSPDILITLTKSDGKEERIDIYGCFMHYKDKQYIINYDKFFKKWY